MSRKQEHGRFQQTDLPEGRSSGMVVDKFGLTSMLSAANYGPIGFERRSPPSNLTGLESSGVPPLNLERSGLARGAPPRPSSMLSDGGSATSLESSPRFLEP